MRCVSRLLFVYLGFVLGGVELAGVCAAASYVVCWGMFGVLVVLEYANVDGSVCVSGRYGFSAVRSTALLLSF